MTDKLHWEMGVSMKRDNALGPFEYVFFEGTPFWWF